jgi:hypothetical protein
MRKLLACIFCSGLFYLNCSAQYTDVSIELDTYQKFEYTQFYETCTYLYSAIMAGGIRAYADEKLNKPLTIRALKLLYEPSTDSQVSGAKNMQLFFAVADGNFQLKISPIGAATDNGKPTMNDISMAFLNWTDINQLSRDRIMFLSGLYKSSKVSEQMMILNM